MKVSVPILQTARTMTPGVDAYYQLITGPQSANLVAYSRLNPNLGQAGDYLSSDPSARLMEWPSAISSTLAPWNGISGAAPNPASSCVIGSSDAQPLKGWAHNVGYYSIYSAPNQAVTNCSSTVWWHGKDDAEAAEAARLLWRMPITFGPFDAPLANVRSTTYYAQLTISPSTSGGRCDQLTLTIASHTLSSNLYGWGDGSVTISVPGLATTEWHHIVTTIQGGGANHLVGGAAGRPTGAIIKIYVDGDLVHTHTCTTSSTTRTPNFTRNGFNMVYAYDRLDPGARMDELSTWERVLTAAEVAEQWQVGMML